jgi:hypothetical protein
LFDELTHRTRPGPRGAPALALVPVLVLCSMSPAFAHTTMGTTSITAAVQVTVKLDGMTTTEAAHVGRNGAITDQSGSTDLYRVGFL